MVLTWVQISNHCARVCRLYLCRLFALTPCVSSLRANPIRWSWTSQMSLSCSSRSSQGEHGSGASLCGSASIRRKGTRRSLSSALTTRSIHSVTTMGRKLEEQVCTPVLRTMTEPEPRGFRRFVTDLVGSCWTFLERQVSTTRPRKARSSRTI